MGMFDRLVGHAHCPNCGKPSEVEIQFKWGDCRMAHYTIGDEIDYFESKKPLSIIDKGTAHCDNCQEDNFFTATAIARNNKVYGFMNEVELEELIPFLEQETVGVSLSIPVSEMKNLESLSKKLAYLLAEVKEGENIYIGELPAQLNGAVCRIPYGVMEQRFTEGDTAFYVPDKNAFLAGVKEKNPVLIKGSTLDEDTQLYIYEIEDTRGQVIQEVSEHKLKNQEYYQKLIQEQQELEEGIIKKAHGQPQGITNVRLLRFKMSPYYKDLLNRLKSENKIPENYS